jgi:hypothetical protein
LSLITFLGTAKINIKQNDGATELVKDETIITLKKGDKGQKLFTKINFDFIGKKQNKTKRVSLL